MLKIMAVAGISILLSSCTALEPENTPEVCASAKSELVTMMNVLASARTITTRAGMEPILKRIDEGGDKLLAISEPATDDEIQRLVSAMGSSFKSYAADGRTTMFGKVDDDRTQLMYSELMISIADAGARCDWPDF